MLKVQFWSPDTCECSLFEAWDPDDPSVIHAYVTRAEAQQIVDRIPIAIRNTAPQPEPRLCAAHHLFGHTRQLYDAVLGENRLKNVCLLILGLETAWSYDESRILHVKPKTRTRFDPQVRLDLAFGPGRVVVDA